jgi:hypothetical protein
MLSSWKLSALGAGSLALAWLLSSVWPLAWLLALLAVVLQAGVLVRGSTPAERRIALIALGATALLLAMPIWRAHLGEPPRPNHPEDLIPHRHPIWDIRHVH